jgi:hypothetical protein
MKNIFVFLFTFCIMFQIQATEVATKNMEDNIADNFIIVVGQFSSESSAKELLSNMKKEFKDAGVYFDEKENNHYVYVETYYAKTGADYAVWWLKKNRPTLPKVWSKVIDVK